MELVQETAGEIRIEVCLELSEGELPPVGSLGAYLFAPGGKLLRQVSFLPRGVAVIHVPARLGPGNLSLWVGPLFDGKVTLPLLHAQQCEERAIVPKASQVAMRVNVVVSPRRLLGWLNAECRVQGVLIGRTNVSGSFLDMPLHGATVKVYQLRSYAEILEAIPDSAMKRLQATVGGWGAMDQPSFAGAPFSRLLDGLARELRTELLQAALFGRTSDFRALLIELAPQLGTVLGPLVASGRPLNLPMHLVALARTDSHGRFGTRFHNLQSSQGAPDLYFTASRPQQGGSSLAIHRPLPVNRHVHWNYSGQRVELYCSSPLFCDARLFAGIRAVACRSADAGGVSGKAGQG